MTPRLRLRAAEDSSNSYSAVDHWKHPSLSGFLCPPPACSVLADWRCACRSVCQQSGNLLGGCPSPCWQMGRISLPAIWTRARCVRSAERDQGITVVLLVLRHSYFYGNVKYQVCPCDQPPPPSSLAFHVGVICRRTGRLEVQLGLNFMDLSVLDYVH